jgi:hypothetical protein
MLARADRNSGRLQRRRRLTHALVPRRARGRGIGRLRERIIGSQCLRATPRGYHCGGAEVRRDGGLFDQMIERKTRKVNRDMVSFLAVVAIVVVWVLLMKVILPRLGVPT